MLYSTLLGLANRSLKGFKRYMIPKDRYKQTKVMKIVLLWTNIFLVLFLENHLLPSPGGNIDFILRTLGSLFLSLLMTGLMVHFLPRKVLMVTMVGIWIIVILLVFR